MNIIDYFNKNPEKESHFQSNNDTTFYYVRPLYITKAYLKCHGKKADTIKTIREK